MNLFVLSDLHNEFGVLFEPDASAVRRCDAVVLAGDIDKGTKGLSWARRAFGDKPIIYVAGNHEFYGHHWMRLLDELHQEARRWDIHFLENGAFDLCGARFLGCSLWTDFKFFRYQSSTSSMRACERGMNDFRDIRADPLLVPGASPATLPARVRYGKRLTAQHVSARHRASVAWLSEHLQNARDEGQRPIVITHHLPSERSVLPRYADSELTPAFASHLDGLIPHAQLWIHGHTHDSLDYTVKGDGHVTRVVCNPRGYPLSRTNIPVFENPTFRRSLIVEV
jgi:predicted phosphodiesterase